MQTIPIIADTRQTMLLTLGRQSVTLSLWWQPLSGAWYLSLRDNAGQPLALGRQIAPRTGLIKSVAFQGEIAASPLSRETTAAIDLDSWGRTHQLLYLTPAEVDQVRWAA